ncbi:MAG: fatty acid desaturase [Anaerolineaceae bacterium]|nr:fatty acid desaturase [Anaerolineaceae bacterium]
MSTVIPSLSTLKPFLRQFEHSQIKKALWQLLNTLIPYFFLWWVMLRLYQINPWLVIPVAFIAAGFLARIFIFFHDCGHQSFFNSQKANQIVGFFLGLLTLTPSEHWWKSHAIHHSTMGNLDKRGIGDVETITLNEYRRRTSFGKLQYRLYRHPIVMFLLGPFFVFFLRQRVPIPWLNKKAGFSVILVDLLIVLALIISHNTIGILPFIMIQSVTLYITGIAGIWLFYVQHQFPEVYWARNNQWDYVAAAYKGASYYHLPKVLQWFTGNIGFHHIHHLRPRIPNYLLDKCYQSTLLFQNNIQKLDLRSSLRCMKLALYDEEKHRLVGF